MAPRSSRPDDRQERVGDVIDKSGGFRRLARFPFWMRPGHVEEIYEATGCPLSTRSSLDVAEWKKALSAATFFAGRF